MTYNKSLILALCAFLFLSSANAQENKDGISGTINAAGGYGTTAPWEGDVRMLFRSKHVHFSPFVAVKGIGNTSSNMLNDLRYVYTGNGNTFTSHEDLESSGTHLKYGFNALFPNWNFGRINLNMKGEQVRKSTTGTLLEQLTATDGTLLSDYKWNVNKPDFKKDRFDASADYTYKDFRLSYAFTHEKEYEAVDRYAKGGYGGQNFNEYHRTTDTRINEHHVALAYDFHPAKAHLLTLGANFDHTDAERAHTQNTTPEVEVEPTFTHRQQTGAAHLAYRFGNKWLRAAARLEYAFTYMKDNACSKRLHDVLPMAHLDWSVTQKDTLALDYRMIIKRPDLELLDPTREIGSHSIYYGNITLEGIHINNLALAYRSQRGPVAFGATLGCILVQDGFNAIWMQKNNIQESTWQNEGIRRAVSLAPHIRWQAAKGTTLSAKATLLWDKRIAEAINMEKEHWGITTELGLRQQLPWQLSLAVNGRYSDGNTINLYSHEGCSYMAGTALTKTFLKKHTLTLSYEYIEHPEFIITQGAVIKGNPVGWTGYSFLRPGQEHTVRLSASFKI